MRCRYTFYSYVSVAGSISMYFTAIRIHSSTARDAQMPNVITDNHNNNRNTISLRYTQNVCCCVLLLCLSACSFCGSLFVVVFSRFSSPPNFSFFVFLGEIKSILVSSTISSIIPNSQPDSVKRDCPFLSFFPFHFFAFVRNLLPRCYLLFVASIRLCVLCNQTKANKMLRI